MHKIVCNNCK